MDLKELLAERKKIDEQLRALKGLPLDETVKAVNSLQAETAKLQQQLKEEK